MVEEGGREGQVRMGENLKRWLQKILRGEGMGLCKLSHKITVYIIIMVIYRKFVLCDNMWCHRRWKSAKRPH